MPRKSVVLALAFAVALVSASSSSPRTVVLAGTATFKGSGTQWTMELMNTGTDALRCMRAFAPTGNSWTSATGPSGTVSQGSVFGNAALNVPANGTATFMVATAAPLTQANAPRVNISANCQTDVAASVIVTSLTPPAPKVCECKSLRVVAKNYSSTGGSSATAKPPTVLKLTLHWFMTCSAGGPQVPLTGCAGSFEVLPPPGTDLKIATPKSSVSCTGKCNPKLPVTSDGAVLMRATSVNDLGMDQRRGKTMAFRLRLFCNRGGQEVPVGTETISLVFNGAGFLDKKKSDLNGNKIADGKEKKK